jgi:hypothetical protein
MNIDIRGRMLKIGRVSIRERCLTILERETRS